MTPSETGVERVKSKAATMRRIQQLHLWLGTFFAPLIIFFAFTGVLQTLLPDGPQSAGWLTALENVHKHQELGGINGRGGRGGSPGGFPVAGDSPQGGSPQGGSPQGGNSPQGEFSAGDGFQGRDTTSPTGTDASRGTDGENAGRRGGRRGFGSGNRGQNGEFANRGAASGPLKWLVALMGVGLIVTTALGIYMSFKYSRNKAVVWALLIVGTVLPLALLLL